jgi:hypothetical protein
LIINLKVVNCPAFLHKKCCGFTCFGFKKDATGLADGKCTLEITEAMGGFQWTGLFQSGKPLPTPDSVLVVKTTGGTVNFEYVGPVCVVERAFVPVIDCETGGLGRYSPVSCPVAAVLLLCCCCVLLLLFLFVVAVFYIFPVSSRMSCHPLSPIARSLPLSLSLSLQASRSARPRTSGRSTPRSCPTGPWAKWHSPPRSTTRTLPGLCLHIYTYYLYAYMPVYVCMRNDYAQPHALLQRRGCQNAGRVGEGGVQQRPHGYQG